MNPKQKLNMKTAHNHRSMYATKTKSSFNETTLLSGLTISILGYIALQFIYPLIIQGLLF